MSYQTKYHATRAMLEKLSLPHGERAAFISKRQVEALIRFAEDYGLAFVDWDKETEFKSRLIDIECLISGTVYRFMTTLFGDGRGLEATEKKCGLPIRSGKVVLLIAAEQLVSYYFDE